MTQQTFVSQLHKHEAGVLELNVDSVHGFRRYFTNRQRNRSRATLRSDLYVFINLTVGVERDWVRQI